jgi:hypothetical protein
LLGSQFGRHFYEFAPEIRRFSTALVIALLVVAAGVALRAWLRVRARPRPKAG